MINSHTLHGVAPRGTRGFLAALALLVVGVATVVAVPSSAVAAVAAFPFADNNNNGVFDSGIDVDITTHLQEGYYSTTESIVLPAKMKAVKSKGPLGISMIAGKNITINGDINASAYATGLTVVSEHGNITVGPGAKVGGTAFVYMIAGGDLSIGAKASIGAAHPKQGSLWLYAEGNLLIGDHVKLQGQYSLDLASNGGWVRASDAANFQAGSGRFSVWANTDISINDCKVKAGDTSVYTLGHLVEFRNNRVNSNGGSLDIFAAGSTIDVTGSVWNNVDHVSLHAETVIGR